MWAAAWPPWCRIRAPSSGRRSGPSDLFAPRGNANVSYIHVTTNQPVSVNVICNKHSHFLLGYCWQLRTQPCLYCLSKGQLKAFTSEPQTKNTKPLGRRHVQPPHGSPSSQKRAIIREAPDTEPQSARAPSGRLAQRTQNGPRGVVLRIHRRLYHWHNLGSPDGSNPQPRDCAAC